MKIKIFKHLDGSHQIDIDTSDTPEEIRDEIWGWFFEIFSEYKYQYTEDKTEFTVFIPKEVKNCQNL